MTITELVLENQKMKLDAQREAEHHDRMVGELEKVYKERDEARSEQSSIQCAFEDSQDKIEELERERDEWAAMCGRYKQERDETRAELSLKCQTVTIAEGTISDLLKKSERLEKMCVQYKQERDEAREAARRYLTELKNNGH